MLFRIRLPGQATTIFLVFEYQAGVVCAPRLSSRCYHRSYHVVPVIAPTQNFRSVHGLIENKVFLWVGSILIQGIINGKCVRKKNKPVGKEFK